MNNGTCASCFALHVAKGGQARLSSEFVQVLAQERRGLTDIAIASHRYRLALRIGNRPFVGHCQPDATCWLRPRQVSWVTARACALVRAHEGDECADGHSCSVVQTPRGARARAGSSWVTAHPAPANIPAFTTLARGLLGERPSITITVIHPPFASCPTRLKLDLSGVRARGAVTPTLQVLRAGQLARASTERVFVAAV